MLIDKEGENRVSVQDVLLELRKYRMGLIQTHDQLTFSYEAIVEGMKRMNNDVSCCTRCLQSRANFHLFQTFNELDNLEIATGSDHDEDCNSPPPLPPRTSSTLPPLPISPPDSRSQLEQISEPSDPTSSDVSDIRDDESSDSSDSDSDENGENDDMKKLTNGQRIFDANSSLPPVPNGTLDLTIPSEKQRFSSDEER